jgi:predicted metalloendopeptidase
MASKENFIILYNKFLHILEEQENIVRSILPANYQQFQNSQSSFFIVELYPSISKQKVEETVEYIESVYKLRTTFTEIPLYETMRRFDLVVWNKRPLSKK